MTRIEEIKALSDNGAEASWPLIHELVALVEAQNEALEVIYSEYSSNFPTIVMASKCGAVPDKATDLAIAALAAYNAFNKGGE